MNLARLLLSSVAVSWASGGLAAEPMTAEPSDQYAHVCDAFGAGFWYIPNTDTCLAIGGYVRAESH